MGGEDETPNLEIDLSEDFPPEELPTKRRSLASLLMEMMEEDEKRRGGRRDGWQSERGR